MILEGEKTFILLYYLVCHNKIRFFNLELILLFLGGCIFNRKIWVNAQTERKNSIDVLSETLWIIDRETRCQRCGVIQQGSNVYIFFFVR